MSVCIATRGGAKLYDDGDGMGHVEGGSGIGPSLPVEAILKWGYWEPVPVTAAVVEENADGRALVKKYQSILERNAKRCVRNYKETSKIGLTAATVFDAAKHPRHPAGSKEGGRFRTLADVKQANPDVLMAVSEHGDAIVLHGIQSIEHGQGHGSKALDDLGAYADSVGKDIYLTPEQADDEPGTLTTPQLREWYKRHGYERAHKRMEDYQFSEAMVRRALTAAAEQNRNPQLSEILDEDALRESSAKATQALRQKIARDAALQTAAQFAISFAVSSPYIRQLVEQHAGRQAERIVAGTRDIVASIILDSITGGWSVPETAAQIYEQLAEAKEWQATMLARTDLIAMRNGGSFAAASQAPGPMFKRWLNADDEKVRPTHVEANFQVVPLESPFSVGGASLMYPGDPSGPDQEVINCRCTLIYTNNPDVLVSSGWDESKHPRHPGGSEAGGEFAPKYHILGTSDDVTECDNCGRSDLKSTVALEDAEGNVRYCGSECASRLAGYGEGAEGRKKVNAEVKRLHDLRPHQRFLEDVTGVKQKYDRSKEQEAISKMGWRQEDYNRLYAKWLREHPDVLVSAAWDESEHPRHPEGTHKGGKFAPKGEELFVSEPEDWGTVVGHQVEMQKLWTEQKVYSAEIYGDLAKEKGQRYSKIANEFVTPEDAALCKIRVQEQIAAQLKDDPDFRSLIAKLDPYGDWKSEFEPGGEMATADTVEKQTAALAINSWAQTSGDHDPTAIQFQIAAENEFGLEPNEFVMDAYNRIIQDWGPERDKVLFNEQEMRGARKFLRAQYDLTQQMLQDAGIDSVYLYRGMKFGSTDTDPSVPSEIKQAVDDARERFYADDKRWSELAADDPSDENLRVIGNPPKMKDYAATTITTIHQNPLSSWAHDFNSAATFAVGNYTMAVVGTRVDRRRILSTPFTGFGCLNENEMVVLGDVDMDGFVWAGHNDLSTWWVDNDKDFHDQWARAYQKSRARKRNERRRAAA